MGTKFRRRFGFIAVENGFITIDQLIRGMTVQVREDTGDKRGRRIGEILQSLGYMTASQVDTVLGLQQAETVDIPEETVPLRGCLRLQVL
ncbi:MAG: hypothetical protein JW821_05845 [Deltaproteobacteria bacterium]|nr:hypothetical protein [Deltaproteobacteria bacterium]